MAYKFTWFGFLLVVLLTHTSSAKNYGTSPPALCTSQVLAHKIKGGYTWTLATRMGELLLKAEKKFGPRDKTWTLLGVEFRANGSPQVWYPYSGRNAHFIAIQITENTAQDKKRALFQLAHEVIHTLSPAGPNKKSSVLEEGIATYFSIHSLEDIGISISPNYINSDAYMKAYILTAKLYEKHPDTDQRIQKLRQQGYTFSNVPYDILMQRFPAIDKTHARLLTQRFDTFRQTKQHVSR